MSIFMNNKKTITYAVIVAMVISILSFPTVSYGAEATTKTAPVKKIMAKTVNSSSIKVRWSLSTGADGYEVCRYRSTAKKYIAIKTVKAGQSRTYTNTGLKANKTYYYKVRAYKMNNGKKAYGKFSPGIKKKTAQNATTRGAAVVAKAKSRVGSAYRTGGTGPRAFDCSGLVYWTYKNAGVATKKTVKRTSSAGMYSALKKYSVGTKVKKAQKGDIILFTRGGRISHAAIYAGKGKIVHASTPRTGVCNSTVKMQQRSGAKVKAILHVVEN